MVVVMRKVTKKVMMKAIMVMMMLKVRRMEEVMKEIMVTTLKVRNTFCGTVVTVLDLYSQVQRFESRRGKLVSLLSIQT